MGRSTPASSNSSINTRLDDTVTSVIPHEVGSTDLAVLLVIELAALHSNMQQVYKISLLEHDLSILNVNIGMCDH